ncbi:MAG: DMT family transporter [Bacteroidota bacterium]|nr:DMT family transporter [Bacteroidota bacterium]
MPLFGETCALATAVLWSLTSMVFTSATMRVGAMLVNVARLAFALVFLGVSIALLGIPLPGNAAQLWKLSLSGVIGLAFGDTFLFLAFRRIGARVSMLIMALAPPISALLAWFFLREALSGWDIAGVALTVCGIALVVLARGDTGSAKGKLRFEGVLFAFLGAVGQAVGLIFAKSAFMDGDIDGFAAAFVRISVASILLLPIAMFLPGWRNPFRAFARDSRALFLTAVGSIFGPYLGITLSLLSIAHTDVGVASAIMATPPIIMLPMVHIAWKERIGLRAVAGAFLAVAGVAVLFLR